MTNDGQKVEFENDRVRVVRVKINGREKHPLRTRGNRVLVWLTDSYVIRTEPNGRGEERQRPSGTALASSATLPEKILRVRRLACNFRPQYRVTETSGSC